MTQNTALDKDLAIDTMASWALEGMEPTRNTVIDIAELVSGKITAEEFRRRTMEIAARD